MNNETNDQVSAVGVTDTKCRRLKLTRVRYDNFKYFCRVRCLLRKISKFANTNTVAPHQNRSNYGYERLLPQPSYSPGDLCLFRNMKKRKAVRVERESHRRNRGLVSLDYAYRRLLGGSLYGEIKEPSYLNVLGISNNRYDPRMTGVGSAPSRAPSVPKIVRNRDKSANRRDDRPWKYDVRPENVDDRSLRWSRSVQRFRVCRGVSIREIPNKKNNGNRYRFVKRSSPAGILRKRRAPSVGTKPNKNRRDFECFIIDGGISLRGDVRASRAPTIGRISENSRGDYAQISSADTKRKRVVRFRAKLDYAHIAGHRTRARPPAV